MSIRVLVASASILRQSWYREQLEQRGCVVQTADDAISCLERAIDFSPDIMVLESCLTWGGAEDVLSAKSGDERLVSIPAVVIDVQGNAAHTYRISAHELAGYWKSQPTAEELMLAIRMTVGGPNSVRSRELNHAVSGVS